MSVYILHISDLHLKLFETDKGVIKSHFDELDFRIKLYKKIKDFGKPIEYVIVTGDLANTGEDVEFKIVSQFFEELAANLNISKKNFIICPGNHDLNWNENMIPYHKQVAADLESRQPTIKEQDAFKYQNEKFKYFIDFYKKFYSDHEIFNPNLALFREVEIIIDNNKILLCAINSCHKESFSRDSHYGHINYKSLSDTLIDENIFKIALFHHIPVVLNGTKSINNWNDLRFLFRQKNVKIFIFGHQHVSHSSEIKQNNYDFVQLSVGSLGKIEADVENTFNILQLSITDKSKKLTVIKHPFQYIQYSNDLDWSYLSDKIEKFKVNLEPKQIKKSKESKDIVNFNNQIGYKFPEKIIEFSSRIIEEVKSNKLFRSGHFHWNESTRTLGFIDTYAILSKRKSALLAKGSMLELIKSNNIKSDLIIGLGQEGNIIGAFLASTLGMSYTFIPYHNRKLDYNTHENDLKLLDHKEIMIVTDVICSASSICSIINDKNELFKNIKSINIISLFYINREVKYNPDIFKSKDKRINFYTVCDQICIEKCKYPDSEYKNCSIFSNKLETVFTF